MIMSLGLATTLLGGCGSDDAVDNTLDTNIASQQDCRIKDISGLYNPILTTQTSGNVHVRNETDGESLTLFYRVNSDTLHNNDISDLRNFFRQHQNVDSWIIEGYADTKGPIDLNFQLGEKRANGATEYLRMFGSSNMTEVSFGEDKSISSDRSSMSRDRKVIIKPQYSDCGSLTPEGQVISEGLKKFPADTYLLDLSGSMSEEIGIIRSFDFPRNSDIYGFNTCNSNNVKRVNPESVNSCGSTPLYQSINQLLNDSNIDELTLMTDGEDSEGGFSVDDIINKANKNNVKINVIAAGSYNNSARSDLMDLATRTGGGIYIQN